MKAPEWISAIKCPFCGKPVVNEYNRRDVPGSVTADELQVIDEELEIGTLNDCEHVAFASIWGFYGPEIEESWRQELAGLVHEVTGTDYDLEDEGDAESAAEELLNWLDENDEAVFRKLAQKGKGVRLEPFQGAFDSHADDLGGETQYAIIFGRRDGKGLGTNGGGC